MARIYLLKHLHILIMVTDLVLHMKKISLRYLRSPRSITHSLQHQSCSRLKEVSRRDTVKLAEEIKRQFSSINLNLLCDLNIKHSKKTLKLVQHL